MNYRRATCALTICVAALAYTAPNASAADKLRAGKATSDTWPYAALDIGVDEGIFAKYNLDVEVTVLSGGARFQQALAGGAHDFTHEPAAELRAQLSELSNGRARQGFSSTETAVSVFALKDGHLVERQRARSDTPPTA